MSNLMPRVMSEELKADLLKQLDSLWATDANNVICWGAEGTIGLTIIEKSVTDTQHVDVVCTNLTVKFYINKSGQLIQTTIK